MRDRRNAWSVLAETSQRKRSLEIDRLRWDDDNQMDSQGVGWVQWNGLIWLGIGIHGKQK